MKIKELNNKKILVWGLGLEGQACLQALYPFVTASWSIYSDTALSSLENEFTAKLDAVKIIAEPINSELLSSFDVIIKSPGVSIYRPEIQIAIANGVKITSATNIWFAERPNQNVIGVTASKGKSTTSSLLAHILKSQNKSVVLAGNIGKPLISFLDKKYSPDYWVIEFSSYQLTDFNGELTAAIFLNLYSEHLDWHKSIENYHKDKSQIVQAVKNGGFLVTSTILAQQLQVNYTIAVHVYDSEKVQINNRTLSIDSHGIELPFEVLPGNHNLHNAAAAIITAKNLGFDIEKTLPTLREFKPLAHRLEPVKTINDVLYINDSISTIPESTIAAIISFSEKPIILILGGLLRDLDWSAKTHKILQENVKDILLIGQNQDHIESCFKSDLVRIKNNTQPVPNIHKCHNLSTAMQLAKKLALPGWIVLLSPGSASYDQFKNFEERGEQFKNLIAF